MGEAKRRQISGEADYWYHGTNEYFTEWAEPPITSRFKQELHPHPFLSLTKDKELAKGAGDIAHGLCRAKLAPVAKILDMTRDSADLRSVWQMIALNPEGARHALVRSYDKFCQACKDGEILRFHETNRELGMQMTHLVNVSRSANYPPNERANAFLQIQNFTRKWIDSVVSPAKTLGFDGVICAEIDRYRPGGARASRNLYAFTTGILSSPDWLTKPDESLMERLAHLP